MNEFRLIVDPSLAGARNMAIDEALQWDAVEQGVGTLRFYTWSEPTLSLGYFQRYDDRFSHAASRDAAIVRRQTGGGAILHDRELTYSLCLPADHALTRGAELLYTAVHDEFIAELRPRATGPASSWRLIRNERVSQLPQSSEPFLCFQRRARGDVLLVREPETNSSEINTLPDLPLATKVLGSAQRRYRGAILQHGSLLLNRSPLAPELPGWCDVTGIRLSPADLIDSLTVRLMRVFDQPIPAATKYSPHLESNALQLTNSKYGATDWTKRR